MSTEGNVWNKRNSSWRTLEDSPDIAWNFATNEQAKVALTTTSVSAGTYTLSTITVDSKGRITGASSGQGAATTTTAGISKLWTLNIFTTATTNWALPSGTTEVIIEAWGGGGSGAGGNTTTSTRGGGGAGAGYLMKVVHSSIDTSYNITIGAGGAGKAAAAGGANGNTGGNTTVVGTNLGTLTAAGGGGGLLGANGGGAGGTATNGDLNITGQDGGQGQNGSTTFVAPGGSSPRGGQGNLNNVGNAGTIPGGGGNCGNHTAGANSGAGADGRVLIWTR